MKAVVLNGSEKGTSILDGAYKSILDELTALGWDVESFMLHDMKIHHCLGCFGCWVKTPGICVIDDAGRDIAKKVIRSDLSVFLTPITFGGYSSELKKALDRIICLISPFFKKINGEVHHKHRYDRYPRMMYVGVLPRADAESERIFNTLADRNALNIRPPAHASGVIINNQSKKEIREDIQTLLRMVEVEK